MAGAVVLVCVLLMAGAGAIQPVATPLVETPATILTAATPVVTPTAPIEAPIPISTAAPAAVPGGTGAPLTLVLELSRSPAIWGDTVRCLGTSAGDRSVRIFVDGDEVGTTTPDSLGAYSFPYLVDRIQAGTHAVGADAGPLGLAEASLEVAAADPVVLLEVAPSEWQGEPAILCTGNVTANGRPVPGAPVHLVFNDYGTADCVTGPAGQFQVTAGVEGGSHKVVANVSFDDGRPLNPASSAAARVDLPGGFPLLPVLAVVAVLLVASAGFLLWRRGRDDGTGAVSPVQPSGAGAAAVIAPVGMPVTEAAATVPPVASDLRRDAWGLAGDGMRDGIGAVYRDLVARLAEREPGAGIGAMTPGELAAHFDGTPAGVAVRRVAACYEAVEGGRAPTPIDLEAVVEGYVAALSETGRAEP